MVYFMLLCALAAVVPLGTACPTKESLLPCTCEMSSVDTADIMCSGVDNEIDLQNAMAALVGKKYIYSITIQDSVFNFLPQDIFKGLQFEELTLETSSFMDLTDTDMAFAGLENHLAIFYVTDCTFMNEWDWSKLKAHHALTVVDVVGGDLESIGQEISQIGHLNITKLSFDKNEISYVYEKAFSTFRHLMVIVLSNNKMEAVKRSMFPSPAEELAILDLSFNQIQNLPEDLLTDMPALEYLMLDHNRLLTLGHKTFLPVWEQLKEFEARGNEIRCDCRLSWVLDLKFPEFGKVPCAEPPTLKNRELKTLSTKELWC